MIEQIIFYAILTALLSYFIDYCLGHPGGGFSPYEIFSGYTILLCKLRMKRLHIWDDFTRQRTKALLNCENEADRQNTIVGMDITMVQRVYPHFTWERAVGMCAVCTNVWINIVFLIFVLHLGLLPLLYILLLSNFLIRLIIRL